MTPPPARPVITNAPARDRYEAHLDGELAGVLEYIVKRGRIALVHTEVLPAQEGRGVGSALVRFALDDARRRELGVIALCPYVRNYLTRHPQDDDIVVGRA
jgi:predicted GNAT family acetyltransferase